MISKDIRALLVADPELGAGNVLPTLSALGADPAGPGAAFDTPVDGRPAGHLLTLGELRELVAARAAWWHAHGIGRRDPVAVYVSGSADCLLTFLALTWLGAVPALMDRSLAGDIAAGLVRRLRPVALMTDPEHRALLADLDLGGMARHVEAADTGTADPADAPAYYRHHAEDPVAVTHSSGDARMPAAVVHTHASLFAATRLLRLTAPPVPGVERTLSALPAAHASGVQALNTALCLRSEALFLSTPHDGPAVVAAIERWKPGEVLGTAATWAQLAGVDLAAHDLGSVALWSSSGGPAPEPHIRKLVAVGSRETPARDGVGRVPGSGFEDGLGSTEMGHSVFHISHTAATGRYGRCVGVPHGFAEVALLDLATGRDVPAGEVGHLGLRSPTLAPGHWNDSGATYRSRRGGYHISGDLMYRDGAGYYHHVGRAADAVPLGGGKWLYTAMAEERVLAACPEVHDCVVVADRVGGEVVTDVLLTLRAGADRRADRTGAVRAALEPAAAATLRGVVVVDEADPVPGPAGEARKSLVRERHRARTAGPDTGAAEEPPVPPLTERLSVGFAGDGEGEGEMTWGMWEIWGAMCRQESALPIGGRAPLEDGRTLADVADELRYLMVRFPAMRTRLGFDATGRPRQRLFAAGEVALEVYDAAPDADAEDAATAVEAHYRRTPFDYANDWPIRMAVVRQHGRPVWLVTILHHLVTDGRGGAIMLRDVGARETAPVNGMQQLEQARWQRSPAGQRQSLRTLRFFENILRTVPARQLPGPTDPRTPRHWLAEFRSTALAAALPRIAARTGAGTPAVLMALFALGLHRATGISPVVVRPVVSNRFRPALSDVVCPVSQSGMCSLDVEGATVAEVVERAERANISAWKHAYYQPEDLDALIARLSRERGEDIVIGTYFNDRTSHAPRPDAARQPAPGELAAELRAACEDSVFAWTGRQDTSSERFFVYVDDTPDGGLALDIRIDTHYVSPAQAEAFARCMEAAAVEAALDAGAGTPSGVGAPSQGAGR
ncbi:AMP-binding protein [Streptomyces sp. NRRL F-5123]|uniref:AMP-binding protein n=1 Tax=Streptomyces sp. NRRL F-5123 TaxID=1463856 RepID=UPI0007C5CF95|nr:AMP-binding protein [Streptomyces sp. NRRL F-5123]